MRTPAASQAPTNRTTTNTDPAGQAPANPTTSTSTGARAARWERDRQPFDGGRAWSAHREHARRPGRRPHRATPRPPPRWPPPRRPARRWPARRWPARRRPPRRRRLMSPGSSASCPRPFHMGGFGQDDWCLDVGMTCQRWWSSCQTYWLHSAPDRQPNSVFVRKVSSDHFFLSSRRRGSHTLCLTDVMATCS